MKRKVNHNSYNNYDFFLTTAQPFLKYFLAQQYSLLKLWKGEVGWTVMGY